MYLTLNRASPEDIEADPATRAAWAYALRHGPPRPGEEVTHLRVVIDRDNGGGGDVNIQENNPPAAASQIVRFASWTKRRMAAH